MAKIDLFFIKQIEYCKSRFVRMPGIENIECPQYRVRDQKVGNTEWTEMIIDGQWVKDGIHKETNILSTDYRLGTVSYEVETHVLVYNKGSVVSFYSTTEEIVRYC